MQTTKKMPERSCAGCGEKKDKASLLRILRTPSGEILVDETGKKSGRGVYICKNAECLEKARKKKAFSRSLGTEIPEDVYERLSEILTAKEDV